MKTIAHFAAYPYSSNSTQDHFANYEPSLQSLSAVPVHLVTLDYPQLCYSHAHYW
jgi:hypothetical protein